MQEDKVAASKHAEKYAKKIKELEGKNREAEEKLAEKKKKEKSYVAVIPPSFWQGRSHIENSWTSTTQTSDKGTVAYSFGASQGADTMQSLTRFPLKFASS